jgi:hypothetical protein
MKRLDGNDEQRTEGSAIRFVARHRILNVAGVV